VKTGDPGHLTFFYTLPVIFNGPLKFLCDPHQTVTNSRFLRKAASVDTSRAFNCHLAVPKNGGNSPRFIRKPASAAISSCQHWQISPVAVVMQEVRH
jgi:hypothetical protein